MGDGTDLNGSSHQAFHLRLGLKRRYSLGLLLTPLPPGRDASRAPGSNPGPERLAIWCIRWWCIALCFLTECSGAAAPESLLAAKATVLVTANTVAVMMVETFICFGPSEGRYASAKTLSRGKGSKNETRHLPSEQIRRRGQPERLLVIGAPVGR